jgi:trans-2-enoyl-CoA reductase
MTTATSHKVKHKHKRKKKESLESLQAATAKTYIPIMCLYLKLQHPYYSNNQIRDRVLRDAKRIFEESLINSNWPSWVLKED